LLEVVAEDGHSRDKWVHSHEHLDPQLILSGQVTALNELLEKTRAPQAERVEQRPSAETKQALTSGVDEYWNKRHGDLVESRCGHAALHSLVSSHVEADGKLRTRKRSTGMWE
jgi:hypothetical protein